MKDAWRKAIQVGKRSQAVESRLASHGRRECPDGSGADPQRGGPAKCTGRRLRKKEVGSRDQVAHSQRGVVQPRQNIVALVSEARAREGGSIIQAICHEPQPDGAQLGRVDDAEDRGRVEHGSVVREQRADQLGRHVGVRRLHPPGCPSNSTESVAQRRVERIRRREAQ